jgi:hypothetical protein
MAASGPDCNVFAAAVSLPHGLAHRGTWPADRGPCCWVTAPEGLPCCKRPRLQTRTPCPQPWSQNGQGWASLCPSPCPRHGSSTPSPTPRSTPCGLVRTTRDCLCGPLDWVSQQGKTSVDPGDVRPRYGRGFHSKASWIPLTERESVVDQGKHCGAGDGNRTRIASLEGWNSNH